MCTKKKILDLEKFQFRKNLTWKKFRTQKKNFNQKNCRLGKNSNLEKIPT